MWWSQRASYHRPAYQPIASEMVTVNTPGATSADMSMFEYRHVRKSLYPLDLDAQYEHAKND